MLRCLQKKKIADDLIYLHRLHMTVGLAIDLNNRGKRAASKACNFLN
jgi:hypothetical protein